LNWVVIFGDESARDTTLQFANREFPVILCEEIAVGNCSVVLDADEFLERHGGCSIAEGDKEWEPEVDREVGRR
jgi:hypothetical protein